jgi:CRP/FNR family transcriptional regulator, anaerobic regulatory protein
MARRTNTVPCEQCPLRKQSHFRSFSRDELAFMKAFKTGELRVEAGATIFAEKSLNLNLYTVLEGSGFRYKMLEDGRRQILNVLLPGDLVGLQGTLSGEMEHSVEALSSMTLCAFDRSRLNTLFQSHDGLAYDLTWIAAREERLLDENLLSIGRRTAIERIAYVLAAIHHRAKPAGLTNGATVNIPMTQQHLADTLGLSLVHTNKTLAKLVRRGAARWLDRGYDCLDPDLLARIGGWRPPPEAARPFL